ncbi:hypothetical protein [Sphingomonas sp. LHG3406-1]|uniref:hypothetical protein n=1 Tax=Sphingomonas sp. LHG3406-1 TaxID=2804617 RepID=UPI00261DDFBC|nr:hypothetical protein [Sphingomonas sp. LHG3406-1]
MRLAAVLIAALGLGGVASAAPPPPRVFPADWPKTLNGYDLQPLLGAYDLWVQTSQGRILRTSFGADQEWQGKSWRGFVATSELVQGDYGALRVDRLERYCEGQIAASQHGSCTYRYRYVFVPQNGDVAQRAFNAFRAEQLTEFLAREGWEADYSWQGRQRLQSLFARHTDLAAVYEPSLERHDVSSAQCPALEKAIGALGTVGISLDQAKRGNGLGDYPSPHGALTQVEIEGVDASGRPLTLKGATALHSVMQPL